VNRGDIVWMEPWVPAAPRSRWQVVAVGLDGRVTVCRPGEPEAHLSTRREVTG
jgi:hypothetical protein